MSDINGEQLNPIPGLNTLKQNGLCELCNKDAQSDFMICFTCDKKYHVIDCTVDASCSRSFLKNTWPSLQKNYTSIKFICWMCQENKKLNTENIMMERMLLMETNVTTIKSEITEIKKLLLKRSAASDVNNQPAVTDDVLNMQDFPVMTYAQKAEKSIIVIKKGEHEIDNTSIIKVAVNSKAAVTSMYKNKSGDTVLICDNNKSKEKLLPNLKEKMKGHTLITPPARQPTITITAIDSDYTKENLFEMIRDQNVDRNINIDENNFRLLFTRPHAKNPNLFLAVARVSDHIRTAIKDAGDKLCISVSSCAVYDRLFIKRCNRCQGFHHFKNDCSAPNPTCAKCTGSHETHTCTSNVVKCANCALNGYAELNHLASDNRCQTYIAAQEKLKSTINYYASKN